MRHAKSDWSSEYESDFERPLAARGIKATKLMASWLKKNQAIPDKIICSPALRTKQTCQLILNKLDLAIDNIYWENKIYNASLDDLLSVIKQHNNNTHVLLIIGHNPGLDQLLVHLSKESPYVNASDKLLTTAALAILDYGHQKISTKPRQANLESLIRPKELF